MINQYREAGYGTLLAWRGPWVAGMEFDQDDFSSNDIAAWKCKKPHIAAGGNEPTRAGIGGAQDEFWELLFAGVIGLAGSFEQWHESYQAGHSYIANDLCTEAASGEGASLWICYNPHTGEAGVKNPTGSSGSSYWKKAVGGGINGVSSLTAALDSLAEATDAPVGASDFIVGKFAGVWKKIKPDNYAKKKEYIHIPVQSLWKYITGGVATEAFTWENGNGGTIYIQPFAQSVKTHVGISYPMPTKWDGSTIRIMFLWLCSGTTSNSARWGARAMCVGDGELLNTAFGTAQEVTDAAGGASNQERVSGFTPAITVGGSPAGGKKLELDIYRDGTNAVQDTLAEVAYLTDVIIEYGVNQH